MGADKSTESQSHTKSAFSSEVVVDLSSKPQWLESPDWVWTHARRSTRVLLWVLCLIVAEGRLRHARSEFGTYSTTPDEKRRADVNNGHVMIDFGGQWLMGRMLVKGHGRELYHRNQQWPIVWQAYPVVNEGSLTRFDSFPAWRRPAKFAETDGKHDAELLMQWMMGTDAKEWQGAGTISTLPFATNALIPEPFTQAAMIALAWERLTPQTVEELNRPAIGGPLYPPIHAFLCAPLARGNNPQGAYQFIQYFSVALTFFAGYGIVQLSRGRIWWSAATLGILLFPGYRSGLDLGQNQVFTLTILLWGWVCYSRGHDGWAGVIWGMLAFKPVWAVTFFLVPLVMQRWRFVSTMAATGTGMIIITIPFVGVQAWWDWLAVGQEASSVYEVNQNWIALSRDLAGIVRRYMIDFKLPDPERHNRTITIVSWGLIFLVFSSTIGIYFCCAVRRYRVGLSAGFLLLGAYLCCYRFMYYDALLSLLPLAVLLSNPRWFSGSSFSIVTTSSNSNLQHWSGSFNSVFMTLLCGLYLLENCLMYLAIEGTLAMGVLGTNTTVIGGMPSQAPKITINTTVYHPIDTYLLLIIWAWCGVRFVLSGDVGDVVHTPRNTSSANPMSGDRINDSPTKTA